MSPTRDPFPFPHYESENTCPGQPRNCQKALYALPTHLVQQRDPWNRLHAMPTLASTRRQVWYTEPEVSRDSLDFNLSSLYNHHKDLLKEKSKVVLHKETIFDDHGALKSLQSVKERAVPPVQPHTSKGISVRHWVNPVKESIHSFEGAIESPHTAATNSGYSRKENGGIFYH
ncbi:cilia- and flagella-associated protein 276 [Heteronotia binoei]|uniref:cilia- and flagella-associated protein 276 n=1 Tax=Heteronotia binoei TaxID=13085 RepID=UPI00293182B3|nr:cilia- and flagella-associated protein 276 [Heteronotia binoei]